LLSFLANLWRSIRPSAKWKHGVQGTAVDREEILRADARTRQHAHRRALPNGTTKEGRGAQASGGARSEDADMKG
jgi:hypothetical protein